MNRTVEKETEKNRVKIAILEGKSLGEDMREFDSCIIEK